MYIKIYDMKICCRYLNKCGRSSVFVVITQNDTTNVTDSILKKSERH